MEPTLASSPPQQQLVPRRPADVNQMDLFDTSSRGRGSADD